MRRTWRLPATERVIARPLRGTIATEVAVLLTAAQVAAILPTGIAALACLSAQIAAPLTAEIAAIRTAEVATIGAAGSALTTTRSIAAGWPIECRACLTCSAPRGHR